MIFSSGSGGTCSEAEHRLFSVIFSNYNQYIRPVENVSDPVIVQFEVSMSQLVKVVSIRLFLCFYSFCDLWGIASPQPSIYHSVQ